MSIFRRHLASTDRPKPVFYRILHFIVPICLITAIILIVGADDILSRLRSADLNWVILAVLACSVQIVVCAVRWQLTAARLGARMPLTVAIAEYYFGSLINTTVPGGVVGDAVRAVRTRSMAGLERAAQSVVIERLAGQIALGGALVLGLLLSGRPSLQFFGYATIAGVVVTGIVVWLAPKRFVQPFLPQMIVRFGGAIMDSWSGLRTAFLQTLYSLVIVAANIAGFVFAARATGTIVPFPEMLFAVPLILAAMLIPLSVAGWGYREGAAAAVFVLIGAPAAEGVAASVVFGAVILISSLPGLVVLWLRDKRPTEQSAATDQESHEPAE